MCVKLGKGSDSDFPNQYNLHNDFRQYNKIRFIKNTVSSIIEFSQISFQHHFPQLKNYLHMLRIRQTLLLGQTLRESMKLIFGARIKKRISNLPSELVIGRVLSDASVFIDGGK